MSQATGTIAAAEANHLFASVAIPCEAGRTVLENFRPCEKPAAWAIRTHDGNGVQCPLVSLVCDHHLAVVTAAFRTYTEWLARHIGFQCSTCKQPITSFQDFIWGIERITP